MKTGAATRSRGLFTSASAAAVALVLIVLLIFLALWFPTANWHWCEQFPKANTTHFELAKMAAAHTVHGRPSLSHLCNASRVLQESDEDALEASPAKVTYRLTVDGRHPVVVRVEIGPTEARLIAKEPANGVYFGGRRAPPFRTERLLAAVETQWLRQRLENPEVWTRGLHQHHTVEGLHASTLILERAAEGGTVVRAERTQRSDDPELAPFREAVQGLLALSDR